MTAESYRERRYADPCTIESVLRGKDDHGVHTVRVTLNGESWGQGFGFWGMKTPEDETAFIKAMCDVFGVIDAERLIGMKCLALREFPYNSEPIVGLRSVDSGRSFVLQEWAAARFDHPLDDGLQKRREDILRDIKCMQRRCQERLRELDTLESDFRPVRTISEPIVSDGDTSVPFSSILLAVKQAQNIVFRVGPNEMVRIEPDGFFVDGVKINDDPKKLYDAMAAWVVAQNSG